MTLAEKRHAARKTPLPTPLELAHLAADLKRAGIVQHVDGRELLTAGEALAFLAACNLAIERESLAREQDQREADDERTGAFLARFAPGAAVPVKALVDHCAAGRIKPTAVELKAIDERRPWPTLSAEERAGAIFLVLTNRSRRVPRTIVARPWMEICEGDSYEPAPPIGERRKWLSSGVPIERAAGITRLMQWARAARCRELGKVGAERKRRKPRAPRGPAGFEAKARHSTTGKFKPQKK